MNSSLSEFLQSYVKKHGLSIAAFASKTGTSHRTAKAMLDGSWEKKLKANVDGKTRKKTVPQMVDKLVEVLTAIEQDPQSWIEKFGLESCDRITTGIDFNMPLTSEDLDFLIKIQKEYRLNLTVGFALELLKRRSQ